MSILPQDNMKFGKYKNSGILAIVPIFLEVLRTLQQARRETRVGAAAKKCRALARPAGGKFAPTVRNARAPAIWVGEIVHMH